MDDDLIDLIWLGVFALIAAALLTAVVFSDLVF